MECKFDGKFHVKENISLRLIANKYREGDMKRTLKRKLKEPEIVEQKANGHVCDGSTVVHLLSCVVGCVQWFLP